MTPNVTTTAAPLEYSAITEDEEIYRLKGNDEHILEYKTQLKFAVAEHNLNSTKETIPLHDVEKTHAPIHRKWQQKMLQVTCEWYDDEIEVEKT